MKPIGVFDSGVGGLTVVRALCEALPQQPLVYLGDTARVPYGTKSKEVVERYAHTCAQFLLRYDISVLVVACNTASAFAAPALRETLSIPVLDVIAPSARLAAKATRNGRIGVISTESTRESGAYVRALAEVAPAAKVHSAHCALFVPFVEEGLVAHPALRILAAEYLAPLRAQDIDTLILGCTHYPLLRPLLSELCGPSVTLVDCASSVAAEVARLLPAGRTGAPARHRFFCTDAKERFARIGRGFLGMALETVEHVDL